MILATLAQGAAGTVSGGAHVVGDLMREMIQRFKTGDVRGATGLHRRLLPLHRALVPGGRVNPIPAIREAFGLASGIDVGPPRPPLLPLAPDERAHLHDVLVGLERIHAGG
jgi:4-hydroxy-tetrahydrodipicolinate synthase